MNRKICLVVNFENSQSFLWMGDPEKVLGVFPSIVRRKPAQAFFTSDRLILHASGSSIDDAEVIQMANITGHILNKPKVDLPQDQQKALVKIFYRDSNIPEPCEIVIDLTGGERFSYQTQVDALLRQFAGDKAEMRRTLLQQQQQRVKEQRQRFLSENPDIGNRFIFLTQEGGLSPEEFWEQHEDALLLLDSDEKSDKTSVPIPLRRPNILRPEIALNVTDRKELEISVERAEEIFSQFPNAKELFDQLVPTTISEKNFWRRFFHSQYFNLTQGIEASSAAKQDPYFDSLLKPQEAKVQIRPGFLPVDPEIDLTSDYLVSDDTVFAFREDSSDSATRTETGGKPTPGQIAAHCTLINRFNQAGALTAVNDSLAEEKILSIRRNMVESHQDTDLLKCDLATALGTDAGLASKADLEKLSRKRDVRKLSEPAYGDWLCGDVRINQSHDRSGSAEALINLTQELVVPLYNSSLSTKKSRYLSSSQENTEVNEALERITELLKFFYCTRLGETDKRAKVLASIDKVRRQMSSMGSRLKLYSDWLPSLNAAEAMITRAEDVNAALS
jgi:hypothetical protein